MNVSACLVTRGDVELGGILESIKGAGIEDIVIWDNSVRDDLAVYGRYAAIAEARHPLIFTQDDDCLLDPERIEEILCMSETGCSDYGQLVCNQPDAFRHDFYEEHSLVGFGAAFHRHAPARAFAQFFKGMGATLSDFSETVQALAMASQFGFGFNGDPDFFRTCDIVFTALTPRVLVDVPYVNLPWASASNRMYTQIEHIEERQRMLDLVREVRNGG